MNVEAVAERDQRRRELYGALVFPFTEYQGRLQRASALMDAAHLDALLLTDDRNILYFAGWGDAAPGGARARPRFLVLERSGHAALLVHAASANSASDMSWMSSIRSYEPLGGVPLEDLQRWLAELGLARGPVRLGMELGTDQRLDVTWLDFQALGRNLPGVELVDASALLWQVRMVKSAAEIQRIRQACDITSRAYEQFFRQVSAGMPETEIGALFQRCLTGQGASGACYVLVGNGRYERGNSVATTYRVKTGEMVWVDGGANVGGYRADFSRAGVLGQPTAQQQRRAEAMVSVVARVVDTIEPGVRTADLARRCDEEMSRSGLAPNTGAGRHGHGLGLLVTEPPDVAAHDATLLEPGMVITIEPGYVAEDGRYHFEQDVLVTPDGHEILSLCPPALRGL